MNPDLVYIKLQNIDYNCYITNYDNIHSQIIKKFPINFTYTKQTKEYQCYCLCLSTKDDPHNFKKYGLIINKSPFIITSIINKETFNFNLNPEKFVSPNGLFRIHPEFSVIEDVKINNFNIRFNNRGVDLLLGINLKKFVYRLENKLPIQYKNFILYHLYNNIHMRYIPINLIDNKYVPNMYITNYIKEISKEVDYSKDYDIKLAKSIQENIDFKLYKHQISNVIWMSKIEDILHSDKQPLTFITYTQFPIKNLSNWYINYTANSQGYKNILSNKPTKHLNVIGQPTSFKLRGGLLLDEMGLGKSATIIAHCLWNSVELKNKDNVKFVHSTKYSSYLQTHNFYTSSFYTNYRQPKKLIETRASLILVPKHLIWQWHEEIKKTIHHSLSIKVITITETRDNVKLTYKDIITADFVLVSQNLFKSDIWQSYTIVSRSIIQEFKDPMFNIDDLSLNPPKCTDTFPNLYHFLWQRVIIDEAHDICEKVYADLHKKLILSFVSKWFWYVSGTIPTIKHIENIICNLFSTPGTLNYGYPLTVNDKKILPEYTMIARRNTKKSVSNLIKTFKIHDNVKFLEFSDTERISYSQLNTWAHTVQAKNELRMFCTCPMLQSIFKNCVDINDIPRAILGKTAIILETLKAKKEEVKAELAKNDLSFIARKEYNKSLSKFDEQIYKEETKKKFFINIVNIIQKYGKSYIEKREISTSQDINLKIDLAQMQAEANNSIELEASTSSSTDENDEFNCGICFDKISELTITPCAHMFCYECITTNIKTHNICPICRRKLNKKMLLKVVDNVDRDGNDPETKKSNRVKYGTKIASLLQEIDRILEESATNRILIFSQWDILLKNLFDIFEALNVKIVKCMGTARQCGKALKTFNESEEYKIIMLSSKTANNGLNLTAANWLLFVDPVRGRTDREVYDIEEQAIGRIARIGQQRETNIIRFIMKDSIEENLYNKQLTYREKIIQKQNSEPELNPENYELHHIEEGQDGKFYIIYGKALQKYWERLPDKVIQQLHYESRYGENCYELPLSSLEKNIELYGRR